MPPDTITVGGASYPAPGHLSHSSKELLLRCAKSWFLKYLTPAPRSASLWTAVGSAVHEATEAYDRADLEGAFDGPRVFDTQANWDILFGAQLEELYRKAPNRNTWRFSPSEPLEAWSTLGPQLVQSWIDWRQRSPYTVWITPDGQPAIELDVSGFLPGCPVEIKGYVDIVMHDPVLDQLVVIDKKTSKKPPAEVAQFATYAALLNVKYGIRPPMGAAFMNRQGTLARPWDLGDVTPESVGAAFGAAWDQIQSGDFSATPGRACFLCDVSAACAAKGGPLAAIYDPDSPGFELPPY